VTRQTNQLPLFEENAVANATVKITKAGDGLSAALKVRPEALQLGEDVYYVLAARVGKIAHVDNDGVVTREHTVVTQAITAIDPTIAQKAIQSAAEETERLRAEQAGQTSLDDAGAEVVEAEATLAITGTRQVAVIGALAAAASLAVAPGAAGDAKVWDGSVWRPSTERVWDGSVWRPAVPKQWTGTAWA